MYQYEILKMPWYGRGMRLEIWIQHGFKNVILLKWIDR